MKDVDEHPEQDPESSRPKFSETLAWLLAFQLGLGCLPVAFVALGRDGTWHEAVRHGELYLVAVVIGGAAMPALFQLSPIASRRRLSRAILAGGGIVLICLTSSLYQNAQDARGDEVQTATRVSERSSEREAAAVAAAAEDLKEDEDRTVFQSRTLFAMTVALSVGAAYLEHLEKLRETRR